MIKSIQSIVFVLVSSAMTAQIGGTKVFRFLDLPTAARANALGGNTMSIWDDDINVSNSNPALLQKAMSHQLAFNYVNYISDINYGNVAYAHHFEGLGTVAAGIQYFNYGKFDGRDEYDLQTGTFTAADYALNLSLSRPLKDTSFSVGVTLKTIYSHYDQYYSIGNAADLGATYHNAKRQLTISAVVRNFGYQWRPYNNGSDREDLPVNAQIGISKKVAKAPFRLIAVYDNIQQWDLTYESPLDETNQIDPFTNQPVKTQSGFQKFADKFMRHWTLATEIVVSKNFNLRLGYNYRLHKEMTLPDKRGMNGLSFGLGFKIYKFHFSYAFSKQHVAGNSNTFSITTNLASFTHHE